MKEKKFAKLNNGGYSLIELLVVIGIASVLLALASMGISLMFNKDAEAIAVKIDDELTEARMMAMSKAGKFYCVLHIDGDPGDSYVEVFRKKTGETAYSSVRKTALNKKVTIDVYEDSTLKTSTPAADTNIVFVFDKANGRVKTWDFGVSNPGSFDPETSGTGAVGIYKFEIKSRTNKIDNVFLVSTTGIHYTEN